ncbi:MAG: protein-glutamate O-methyltransferase CheR [Gemmobacter sp.]|jgi:chemotaxis protein methyltransferase CheR|nr:protein-glutamate O-methyltransferase CheR [Gemmobacter sp.]
MTPSETAGFEFLRTWLNDRCGIHYPDKKRDLLEQRLSRVLRVYNVGSFQSLAGKVAGDGQHDIQLAVMHAASTNHTYFFREEDVLEQFRTRILPTFRGRGEYRFWSAACSTGDEAYTMAIIIAETEGLAALRRTQILGTDISAPVVERAELGIYGQRQLEYVPRDILQRYFRPIGMDQYQISPELRACCTFRRMNLKTRPYPFKRPFQAVFCRNVLYYFDKPDQIATIEALFDVTEPGGWLFTSVTENLREMPSRWQIVGSGIARKGT